MPTALESIVDTRRVVITVGAGGVGKTTTAAALSVAAAQRGKRVLCLTIDPARRLAQSLGLETMTTEAVEVDPSKFRRPGDSEKGALTVMMLDTKRTFDDLIVKYSSSEERAQRLLSNRIYKYVSTSLAGTQEYMAMEKLIAVKDDARYDLIFLDTPPTANALDFLDAPERLVDALDSDAMGWFIDAFQSTGKLSLNILAKSAAVVLRTVGKITGGGFLEDVARFVTELNDLFGGFKERARRVQETLRGKDVAFVLVTSPSPVSIQEVLYFSDRLEEHNMPRGAFVINRYRLPPPFAGNAPVPVADIAAQLRNHAISLEDDVGERLSQAHVDALKLSSLDARFVSMLDSQVKRGVPLVRVPELSSDVHDVRLLTVLADTLMAGGA
jgi:anion-transporting  ArsA/GET3 family ATPase